jgi:hypothetical protein
MMKPKKSISVLDVALLALITKQTRATHAAADSVFMKITLNHGINQNVDDAF